MLAHLAIQGRPVHAQLGGGGGTIAAMPAQGGGQDLGLGTSERCRRLSDRFRRDRMQLFGQMRDFDLVALDDALQALALAFPRKSQVVELRFFGGLSMGEVAESLQISSITAHRDWQFARAWLARELGRSPQDDARASGKD